MLIEEFPVWARVHTATFAEENWIAEKLSFPNKGAHYQAKALGRDVPDHITAYVRSSRVFPAGFLPLLLRAAKKDNLEAKVIWLQSKTAVDETADIGWLRPYQVEGVNAALLHRRGILWMPTGSGKTECAIALMKKLPFRWGFLVNRKQLAIQAAKRFNARMEAAGIKERAGVIGEGKWNEERCTFVTFQMVMSALSMEHTRQRAIDFLARLDGVIVDECHATPAERFRDIVMRTTGARYRIGLSGTPLARNDGSSFRTVGLLGPIIYHLKAIDLVNNGVLSRPTLYLVRSSECCVVPRATDAFQDAYEKGIVRSEHRNNLLTEIACRARKPAFLFVQREEHGEILLAKLRARGVRAAFVFGAQDSVKMREKRIAELVANKHEVLITTNIFQDGVDVPELASVINAAGLESPIAVAQRLGRGMRKHIDASGAVQKDTMELWDLLDVGCGCVEEAKAGTRWLPVHNGCKWFAEHARTRKRIYLSEGHELQEISWVNSVREGASI